MTQPTDNIARHQPHGAPQHVRELPLPKRPQLITPSEAAAKAATSEAWIMHAIATGQLPGVLVESVSVLIDEGELAAWSAAPQFRLAADHFDHILELRLAKEQVDLAERQERDAAELALRTYLATDHGPERTTHNEDARRANARDALLKLVAEHPSLAERAKSVSFYGWPLLGANVNTSTDSRKYGIHEQQAAFVAAHRGRSGRNTPCPDTKLAASSPTR